MTLKDEDKFHILEKEIIELKSKPQFHSIPVILKLNTLFTNTPQEKVFSHYFKNIKEKVSEACLGLQPEDLFSKFNSIFFQAYEFRTVDDKDLNGTHLLLSEVLYHRTGHPLCVSLIFIYLAQELGENLSFVPLAKHCIIKRVKNKKCYFHDLCQNGKELDNVSLVKVINNSSDRPNNSNGGAGSQPFKTLDAYEMVTLYLNELHKMLRKENQFEKLNAALSLSYNLEPQKHDYLAQRALVRRAMGLTQEAIEDLKRYFAFNEKSQAPSQLKMAYYELQAFCQNNPHPESIH